MATQQRFDTVTQANVFVSDEDIARNPSRYVPWRTSTQATPTTNSFWDQYAAIQRANTKPTPPNPQSRYLTNPSDPRSFDYDKHYQDSKSAVDAIRAKMMGITVPELHAQGALQTYNTKTGYNEFTPRATVAANPNQYRQYVTSPDAIPTNLTPPKLDPSLYNNAPNTSTTTPTPNTPTTPRVPTVDPTIGLFAWAMAERARREAAAAQNQGTAPSQMQYLNSLVNNQSRQDSITDTLGSNQLPRYIQGLYTNQGGPYHEW